MGSSDVFMFGQGGVIGGVGGGCGALFIEVVLQDILDCFEGDLRANEGSLAGCLQSVFAVFVFQPEQP